MILKNISIQNLGAITHFYKDFSAGLNVVHDRRCEALSFAMRAILNHRPPLPPCLSAGVKTKIEADVLVPEKLYRVVASFDTAKNGFTLSCYDQNGGYHTDEYLYLTTHSYEQDAATVFTGEEATQPRFLRYADEDRYYSEKELSRATGGLSDVKAFRRYLRSFIENFKPELLRDGKTYEMFIERGGRYAVRCGIDGEITRNLSETESMIFRYLCFLQTAEFWHGFEEMRNLHAIKKPMIISGFLERIDKSIDACDFLGRAARLQDQTILITSAAESDFFII